ncbi:uncharacterized protein ARMOST_19498 [Armillaria ostoyae]|uniref:Uncharacterized protein n=1 Tax=Armillaria ostoyae TaxID=47428 RepID=A0A284S4P8_ARMOS|nr:uncharacterized protein ARMOST_19498 [Armillaria ostoyae]
MNSKRSRRASGHEYNAVRAFRTCGGYSFAETDTCHDPGKRSVSPLIAGIVTFSPSFPRAASATCCSTRAYKLNAKCNLRMQWRHCSSLVPGTCCLLGRKESFWDRSCYDINPRSTLSPTGSEELLTQLGHRHDQEAQYHAFSFSQTCHTAPKRRE